MSRPRRSFGTTRPGQMLATRLKVVAAELADRQRYGKGREYAASGAVVDVTVAPGVVTAAVLGSRPDPYLAEVRALPGDGPPTSADLDGACTCPDNDATPWCKHVVAALLVAAEEIAVEPELLVRWRDGVGEAPVAVVVADDGDPVGDLLGDLVRTPPEAEMPTIPEIETSPAAYVLSDDVLDRWITDARMLLRGAEGGG